MPLDPNEAPEGYEAVEQIAKSPCEVCAFGHAVADGLCEYPCVPGERRDGANVIFVKRPEVQAAPAAVAEPNTPFTDPRVQIVYGLLADSEAMPPDGQHWEGWVARRIVDALAAAPAAAQPVAQEPDNIPGLAADPSAFVRWAEPAGYDMTAHPLHFLFLTEKTAAARDGWNACRRYYKARAAAQVPQPTPPALVGLSDAQIWDAAWGAGLTEGGEVRDALAFARAIERAMAAANGMTLREPKA